MICEIEALFNDHVDIDDPMLSEIWRECNSIFLTIKSARLLCCTIFWRLPCNISEISAISVFSLPSRCALPIASRNSSISSIETTEKLFMKLSRLFDLMRNSGGQLTERGEFFGLDEAVLGSSQVLQRLGQLHRALLYIVE